MKGDTHQLRTLTHENWKYFAFLCISHFLQPIHCLSDQLIASKFTNALLLKLPFRIMRLCHSNKCAPETDARPHLELLLRAANRIGNVWSVHRRRIQFNCRANSIGQKIQQLTCLLRLAILWPASNDTNPNVFIRIDKLTAHPKQCMRRGPDKSKLTASGCRGKI